jgi:hypothetical protein
MNDGPLDLTVPDSQLIVRAVNTHAELVAAIEMVLDASEDCGDMDDIDWDQLRAALAKVEGGK